MNPGFDMSPGVPPVPDGPVARVILTVLGVPIILVVFGSMSYIGFATWVALFCALNQTPVVAVCVSVVLAIWVFALADEQDSWSIFSLTAAFLTVTLSVGALFYGSGRGAAFGFFCSVLLLMPQIRDARKAGSLRFRKALIASGQRVIELWLAGLIFFPGISFALSTAFGFEVDPFHWRMVQVDAFPWFSVECSPSPGD